MLTRRLARIKAFQAIYAFRQDEGATMRSYASFLKHNIERMLDAYHQFLAFAPDFYQFIELEWEREHEKHFQIDSAIQKLRVFRDNPFLAKLSKDNYVTKQNRQFNWSNQNEHFSTLYKEFTATELFAKYSEKGTQTFASGRKFWVALMHYCGSESELFNHCMEEHFMNWYDDDEAVETQLLKALDHCKEDDFSPLDAGDSLDHETVAFAQELFEKGIVVAEEAQELIASTTTHWDPARMAQVDLMLLQMAVAEFLFFPSIPVKVTINEYLEIAKRYSTPKSNAFLNGILDTLQQELKKQGKLNKTGRGLVG